MSECQVAVHETAACILLHINLRSLVPRLSPLKNQENFLYCKRQKLPYSGIFSREKFFANRRYVRPNGNFGGKIFAVPLKQSHAYLTRATLSSEFVSRTKAS